MRPFCVDKEVDVEIWMPKIVLGIAFSVHDISKSSVATVLARWKIKVGY